MSIENGAPAGPYASLRIKDFRLFILARLCITLAVQIQATVVGVQVYKITNDPFSLGLIGLSEAIPAIAVSLYAGHVADIINRKKIILITVAVLLFCSASLLFFTTQPDLFFGSYGALPIYIIIFISGIARGFLTPANFSFMPQLVPRNLYSNAIVLNSTFWQAGAIGGPVIMSLVFITTTKYNVLISYTLDAFLVLLSLIFYFQIKSRPVPPVSDEQGIIEKIGAGLKFVFKNEVVLSAISLDLFAVLFGGAVALIPAFVHDILHQDDLWVGILRLAPSVGAVITAIYITHYPIKKSIGKKLLLCVAGFGVCMIGFGLSTSIWLSVSLLVLSGAFDSVSVIVRSTLIHTLTPENMKGRVSAVNSIFIGSSNEIGGFESGAAARLMHSLVRSVVFGGVMTLLVVGVTSLKAKKLVKLDNVN
jgi:MFS family permease